MWCDPLRRLFPWAVREECTEDQEARAEAAEALTEALAAAPLDAAQSDYLERRADLNGFTLQLRAGFHRRTVGE